jgi:hypothetical protein
MLAGFKRSLRRRALVRPNALYYYWRYGANAGRTWRAKRHRQAFGEAEAIAGEIARDGIVRSHADCLLSEGGLAHYRTAKAQLLEISRSPEVQHDIDQGQVSEAFQANKSKDYVVNLIPPKAAHSPDSALLRLALDPNILEIAASYFGLWPRLDGIYAWLNFPTDAAPQASQLWHRDPQDLKLLKAFIYLDDVDEDAGPFCYIPKTQSFGAYAGVNPPHKDRKRILDEEMDPVLPPEKQMICTGPADTMILADTSGFHRGGKPRGKNRLMLAFAYTSAWPAKRTLKLDAEPSWTPSDIQRAALKFR